MQLIKEIRIDCDDDAVLLKVEQLGGAACHTGHRSCFYKKIEDGFHPGYGGTGIRSQGGI